MTENKRCKFIGVGNKVYCYYCMREKYKLWKAGKDWAG